MAREVARQERLIAEATDALDRMGAPKADTMAERVIGLLRANREMARAACQPRPKRRR